MGSETTREPDHGPVRQFSIFVENKVGRLHELVESLGQADVHIMALCLVDTTDSTIIRIVVDYPERAEEVLNAHHFAHDAVPVVAIELQSEAQLKDVTGILLKAEINIHYVYPFLFRPNVVVVAVPYLVGREYTYEREWPRWAPDRSTTDKRR